MYARLITVQSLNQPGPSLQVAATAFILIVIRVSAGIYIVMKGYSMRMHRSTQMLLGIVLLIGTGCQHNQFSLKAPELNPVLRKQARDAIATDQLNRAEVYLRRAIERDPTDWRAQRGLANLLMRKGTGRNILEAQLTLEKAWALRDDDPETYIIIDELAETLLRQDKHKRLSKLLIEACQRYRTDYDFLRQGRFLAKTGDIDGAVVAYRKAARFKRGDASAYLELANVFEGIGDIERAVHALRLGYAADPSNALVIKRLRDHGVTPGPTMAVYSDH